MTDERQTTDIPTATDRAPKLYLVFRSDLALGPGKAAVMGFHLCRSVHNLNLSWLTPFSPIIAVRVDDEPALLQIMGEAGSYRLGVASVRDAGRTTLPAGTLVGAAIGPVLDEGIYPLLGKLHLL